MHENFVDVLDTDLAMTALAERRPVESDDPALALLQAWAADIDAHPIVVAIDPPAPAAARRRPRGAARSVAVMTLALTLSSTGIAAAVQGNPFAPFTYVVDKFGHFADDDRTPPGNPLGLRSGPLPNHKDSRIRVEADGRPSRSSAPDRETSSPPRREATAPIEATRVPRSAGGTEERQKPRGHSTEREHHPRRHGPLVVQRPHQDPPERPKPGSGETPPHRPELPAIPGAPSWPKPGSGETPPPPDQPMFSGPGSAPVR